MTLRATETTTRPIAASCTRTPVTDAPDVVLWSAIVRRRLADVVARLSAGAPPWSLGLVLVVSVLAAVLLVSVTGGPLTSS